MELTKLYTNSVRVEKSHDILSWIISAVVVLALCVFLVPAKAFSADAAQPMWGTSLKTSSSHSFVIQINNHPQPRQVAAAQAKQNQKDAKNDR
jgi:hypothetical protein